MLEEQALSAVIQGLVSAFSRTLYVCCHVLQANGGLKDSSQKIMPVGNRTCPPGLEEREVSSLRNLTWFYIPSMLARGGSAVRLEEMDWWQDT